MKPRAVSIVGAPTDVGASVRGASMGPEALRVAGLREAIVRHAGEARDCGNLAGPMNPVRVAQGGYRHLDEVVAWNRQVFAAVAGELAQGRLPVLIGGDHSLSVGSIAAVARHCRQAGRALRVLWLDAHADFNTPALTPSGNLHGMPVACLCGHGPAELVGMGDACPIVGRDALRLLGVRSVDDGERQFLRAEGIDVCDMRRIDEIGMRRALEGALLDVERGTHLHVSLDMDFLDPEIAQGVGTPVRGGPTYREAQLCMEMIADTGCLASLDIMELNPALDRRNATAELAVDLVESLFGKSTLARLGH